METMDIKVDNLLSMPLVTLTGTARESVGPTIGAVEIGMNQKAYLFRVALPGVSKEGGDIKCEVKRDGRISVQGVVTEPEPTRDFEHVIQKQELCPPGPFSVSFNLPGPVDPRLFRPTLRPDGIFEGVVIKYMGPPMDGGFATPL